ncbi:flagellar hook-length control protein FliK [Curtobacterium luteum]|uniref:flagellar hook-length control protein FliK n=1 Tax=Curtobacterium luteum TaxID=33881 RepID=UPI001584C6B3|nr:flagellar hook-length control protein FliK [Curtobacterium luteum]NUU50050.1 flagellar hook-length control protein FliK [Curtobacterium luteum]
MSPVASGTAPAPVAAGAAATPSGPRTETPTTAPAVVVVPAGSAPGPRTGGGGTGTGTDGRASAGAEPGLQAVDGTRATATVAFPTPTVAAAPVAAPSGSATANASPTAFAQQLARPLFSLAQAGPGEHVVTVQVTPDALGPVTVRAHVSAHSMHVELYAPSDAGREAVRQVLPDLRRDAAGTGLSTTLDLSSQNHPDSAPRRDERPAGGVRVATDDREARPGPATLRTPSTTTVRTAGLDVLA